MNHHASLLVGLLRVTGVLNQGYICNVLPFRFLFYRLLALIIILINIPASNAHLAHLSLELILSSLVNLTDGPYHLGTLLDQVSLLGLLALSHRVALAICDQLPFSKATTNEVSKWLMLITILGFHSISTNEWPHCSLIPLIPHIGRGCSGPLVPLIRVRLSPCVYFSRACQLR